MMRRRTFLKSLASIALAMRLGLRESLPELPADLPKAESLLLACEPISAGQVVAFDDRGWLRVAVPGDYHVLGIASQNAGTCEPCAILESDVCFTAGFASFPSDLISRA